MYNRKARDDPKCPSEFTFEPLKDDSESTSKVLASKLALEIAHLLFCRQWKLVCNSSLPNGNSKNPIEILYFCRDGRILPALGQQSFAMIELEQPNKMRLFNIEESIRDSIKACVVKTQPHLEHINESQDFTEFKWTSPVWNHVLEENEKKESIWIKESLALVTIARLLVLMNKHELNLYGVSRYAKILQPKRCQLIFRQSNIAYSRCLCLHLSGKKLVLKLQCSDADISY